MHYGTVYTYFATKYLSMYNHFGPKYIKIHMLSSNARSTLKHSRLNLFT